MITEKETIKCEAVFSDERKFRYYWSQCWNKNKPMACVIMLHPCEADCLVYDTTSYLAQNQIANLDVYGGVVIVNIYSKLTSKLNLRWDSDEELNGEDNDTYIKKAAAECETVILAWGTGALTNKRIIGRINEVMEILKPFRKKLYVITDGAETRAAHPLTPRLRKGWILEPFEERDIEPRIEKAKSKADKKDDDSLLPHEAEES